MCWFSYKLWLLVAPWVGEWVSIQLVGAVLLSVCLVPMVLNAVSPEVRGVQYEHNLGATLQARSNGTLQDSIIDRRSPPGSPQRPRDPVPLEANGSVQVGALLGAVVSSPIYEPPALVVDGVSVASLSQGSAFGGIAQGELLTGHVVEDDPDDV